MGVPYESGDRRPIASREWKLSRMAAHWLAARGISPNAISVAGMIVGLAAGACLAGTAQAARAERTLWLIGAVFIQLRLLANMLDGMVAVETKRASPVGELFNEVPDRVSDSAILIGLGFAAGGSALLGLAAALTAMFTAYVRAVGKAAGALRRNFADRWPSSNACFSQHLSRSIPLPHLAHGGLSLASPSSSSHFGLSSSAALGRRCAA
jgi:phosphatidylglycerophosphate synthase